MQAALLTTAPPKPQTNMSPWVLVISNRVPIHILGELRDFCFLLGDMPDPSGPTMALWDRHIFFFGRDDWDILTTCERICDAFRLELMI